jgi:plastocyanin
MSKRSTIIVILVIIEVILIGGAYSLGARLKEAPDTKKETVNLAEKVKATAEVNISKKGFNPATISVQKGTLVTFTNKDSKQHRVASDPHPTHTKLSSFDSPNLKKGEKYFFLFDKAGTFTYHDHLNPLKFNGTVVVK